MLGVGLGTNLGPASRLCESVFSDGRPPIGVIPLIFCDLRKGDSGLGREGRDFGRKAGLADLNVAMEGPVGVEFAEGILLAARMIGKNMPEPGTDVVK